MTSNRPSMLLGAVLAALAGLVDAIGFLHLHGFFLSFMSGNSTRLSVAIAQGQGGEALAAAGLIGLFACGAMGGAAIDHLVTRRRRAVVLGVEGVLLLAAASLAQVGHDRVAVGALAVAMGCENAVFVHAGQVSVGLTYVTGALVKTAQGLVTALFGGPRLAWLPDAILWSALVGGAIAGSRLYDAVGLTGLWVAVAGVATCGLAVFLQPDRLEGARRDGRVPSAR